MSNSYNVPKLPGPNSPKVSIEVDGRQVEVPGDTNLLEALRTIGIETPHFCYHPELPVAGNCRQCMVETDGPRGMALTIACYTPVRAGMKVATPASSPKVAQARKAVMEYLLVNHPLDCPICDKAGECLLQENYMASDRQDSRLREDIGKQYKGSPEHRSVDAKGQDRGGKAVELGPRVILDEERCILCDRCTRFMRHVAKDEQLYIAYRGDHAFISTFPGQPLDHPYDLNVTDVCPVGALTGEHFRFQQRVWLLQKTPTVDMSDSFGSNIWLEHHDGKVWRIMPRCNPEVNHSWIANSTRLHYQALDQDRLLGGSVNGSKASQGDVLRYMMDKLVGAHKVALVASGHATLEDNAALLTLAQALGSKAEVFGGSWLTVNAADGIALSGDPVANRAGLALLGISDNLDSLAARAREFDVLLCFSNDLWGSSPKAQALESIPSRFVLSAWENATSKAATASLGILAWAEIRGTMVNSENRIQLLNAAPTAPSVELEPAWQVLAKLAGCDWSEVAQAWQDVRSRIPALAEATYAKIGSHGLSLNGGTP